MNFRIEEDDAVDAEVVRRLMSKQCLSIVCPTTLVDVDFEVLELIVDNSEATPSGLQTSLEEAAQLPSDLALLLTKTAVGLSRIIASEGDTEDGRRDETILLLAYLMIAQSGAEQDHVLALEKMVELRAIHRISLSEVLKNIGNHLPDVWKKVKERFDNEEDGFLTKARLAAEFVRPPRRRGRPARALNLFRMGLDPKEDMDCNDLTTDLPRTSAASPGRHNLSFSLENPLMKDTETDDQIDRGLLTTNRRGRSRTADGLLPREDARSPSVVVDTNGSNPLEMHLDGSAPRYDEFSSLEGVISPSASQRKTQIQRDDLLSEEVILDEGSERDYVLVPRKTAEVDAGRAKSRLPRKKTDESLNTEASRPKTVSRTICCCITAEEEI